MLKKAFISIVVNLLWVSMSHAISYKSNDKFTFVDKDGEDIAYVECSGIKYQDAMFVRKLVARADSKEVEVDSVTVKKTEKKQVLVVNYVDAGTEKSFEFETKNSCEISL